MPPAPSHADLVIGEVTLSLTEEARAWNADAPPSLGGSPVVLQLETDDVDALFTRMCQAGATAMFPLMEFCGERMGRVRDPFGHLRIVKQQIEQLSATEIQQRRYAFIESMIAKAGSPSGSSKA